VTGLLDTHCHLDAYPDPRRVLAEAHAASVDVIAVSETPEAYRRLRTRLGRTDGVTVALGLHPASAAAASPGQLERFLRMLPDAPWIGEVGLDFRPGVDRREKVRQSSAFQSLLDHNLSRTKPMTVHSRGAAQETVRRLAEQQGRAVLHWYSGPSSTVDDALAAGLWFSVNTSMIRTAKGRALIARLPPQRVLCETDGPYCRTGVRPAEPGDVRTIARFLADAWSATEADSVRTLVANAAAFAGDHDSGSRPNS
jgi:TatD DNase family protein